MEQTCNLAVLAPSKTIPSGGGTAPQPAAATGGGTLSHSHGAAGQRHSIHRLRISRAGRRSRIRSPVVPTFFCATATATHSRKAASPFRWECRRLNTWPRLAPADARLSKDLDAIKANAASAVRADANGSGTFPGVPPGTYYLMISTRVQQPGAHLGSGSATQGRLQFDNARSEQRGSDQLTSAGLSLPASPNRNERSD
jgi:hypothetical protein